MSNHTKAYEVRSDRKGYYVYSHITYRRLTGPLSEAEALRRADEMNTDHYIDQLEERS